jgi:hypothetical protein
VADVSDFHVKKQLQEIEALDGPSYPERVHAAQEQRAVRHERRQQLERLQLLPPELPKLDPDEVAFRWALEKTVETVVAPIRKMTKTEIEAAVASEEHLFRKSLASMKPPRRRSPK